MEALEKLGVSIGVQTDGTIELIFEFLDSTFSHFSRCGQTTGWASQDELSLLVFDHEFHKAFPAVDMEALEKLGVSIGVQTDGTIELIFEFLDSTFSHFSTINKF